MELKASFPFFASSKSWWSRSHKFIAFHGPLLVTLPETHIFALENGWLEDDRFLLRWPIFRVYVSFREGTSVCFSWWFFTDSTMGFITNKSPFGEYVFFSQPPIISNFKVIHRVRGGFHWGFFHPISGVKRAQFVGGMNWKQTVWRCISKKKRWCSIAMLVCRGFLESL